MQLIDLAGKRFGRLEVTSFAGFKETASGSRQYRWNCRCECGNEISVDGCCLRRGSAISCGCSPRHRQSAPGYEAHGLASHPLYGVWCAMKQRCNNPNHKNFAEYGGRGVAICERWLSFQNFMDDMGNRPSPAHTIERRDNNGLYSPENCVWATRSEQNENTRQTKLITFDGVTLSRGKWARRLGLHRKTLACRLDRLGWSVERTLTTPARPIRQRERAKRGRQ